MKTVRIQGGLGNQLFGLAFAHSVVALGGGPVALDLSGYAKDPYGRHFDTRPLMTGLGPFSVSDRRLAAPGLLPALVRRLPFSGIVQEGEPPTDDASLKRLVNSGRYFNGYWQNEAFMAQPQAILDQVRAFLEAKAAPAAARDVVIHLRTYKEEHRPDRRGIPGPAFFSAALARIEQVLGRPAEVTLISDDTALAMQRLGDLGRTVVPSTNTDAYADVALMLSARALILTNSSFSWWGGFCSDARLAVYPKREGLYHYPVPAAKFVCL